MYPRYVFESLNIEKRDQSLKAFEGEYGAHLKEIETFLFEEVLGECRLFYQLIREFGIIVNGTPESVAHICSEDVFGLKAESVRSFIFLELERMTRKEDRLDLFLLIGLFRRCVKAWLHFSIIHVFEQKCPRSDFNRKGE